MSNKSLVDERVYFDLNGRLCRDPPKILTYGPMRWETDESEAIVVGWEGDDTEPKAFVVYSHEDAMHLLRKRLATADVDKQPRIITWRPIDELKSARPGVWIGNGPMALNFLCFKTMYRERCGRGPVSHPEIKHGAVFLLVHESGPKAPFGIFGQHDTTVPGTPTVHLIASKAQGREIVAQSRVNDFYAERGRSLLDRSPLPEINELSALRIRSHFLSSWLAEYYIALSTRTTADDPPAAEP